MCNNNNKHNFLGIILVALVSAGVTAYVCHESWKAPFVMDSYSSYSIELPGNRSLGYVITYDSKGDPSRWAVVTQLGPKGNAYDICLDMEIIEEQMFNTSIISATISHIHKSIGFMYILSAHNEELERHRIYIKNNNGKYILVKDEPLAKSLDVNSTDY